MQDYEESVSFLGNWGPFQRKIFFVLLIACIPSGYSTLAVIFLLASPTHQCSIPANSNLSQEWIQASIPVQVRTESTCSRYELNLVKNLSAMGASTNWIQNHSLPGLNSEVLVPTLNQEECEDGWTYSTEFYQSTVVTEFDLVCREQWKQPLTSLLFFLGGTCGCFISGQISDRFGRKPVLFGCIGMLSIFTVAAAFAQSWPVFAFCFFMLGVGQISGYVIVFVLGSEIFVGSTRIIFSTLWLNAGYALAMMLMSATAYLVRSWRYLSLLMAVPGLACIPLWWLIPESPRWLVSCGCLNKADLIVRSAALENRVKAPSVIFTTTEVRMSKTKSHSFLDLLKTTNIQHVTMKLWLWMLFSSYLAYFGLIFSMSSLYGNPYLNHFLLATVEIPAYLVSWLLTQNFPRRLCFISFVLLGALALLCTQIVTDTVIMFLVLLSKFGVLTGIGVLYVYSGELFPTVIRNTAMSSCAMFTRVGSSVSPYLMELVGIFEFLPSILMGALLLLSVLLCIFLPETFRQPLPDTIQQMWSLPFNSPSKDEEKSTKEQISVPEVICTSHL
uniref:Major facilitator superfamily (MFS) profile domain-containing protein n=1 Tax=Nothobranchius furzeri TaxID=105023 RepID=A0A8C6LXR7_NOTFU